MTMTKLFHQSRTCAHLKDKHDSGSYKVRENRKAIVNHTAVFETSVEMYLKRRFLDTYSDTDYAGLEWGLRISLFDNVLTNLNV